MRGAWWALLLVCALPGCASGPGDYTQVISANDPSVAFEMVWIPEGEFWIGRTEVTWDEYLAYAGFDLPEALPPGVDAISRPSRPLETTPYDRDWGKGQRPAVGMSRNAARQYCRWLSLRTGVAYRLPLEAEWRLACGDAVARPATAWTEENAGGMTHEVARLAPNEHGLHDILGNVWEYCADPFAPDQRDRAVLRGGAWNTPAVEATPDTRLGFDRLWILADPQVPPGVWWVPEGPHLGFRVVRSGPHGN